MKTKDFNIEHGEKEVRSKRFTDYSTSSLNFYINGMEHSRLYNEIGAIYHNKYKIASIVIISTIIIYKLSEIVRASNRSMLIAVYIIIIAYSFIMLLLNMSKEKALITMKSNNIGVRVYIFSSDNYLQALKCSNSNNYEPLYRKENTVLAIDKGRYEICINALSANPELRKKLNIDDKCLWNRL